MPLKAHFRIIKTLLFSTSVILFFSGLLIGRIRLYWCHHNIRVSAVKVKTHSCHFNPKAVKTQRATLKCSQHSDSVLSVSVTAVMWGRKLTSLMAVCMRCPHRPIVLYMRCQRSDQIRASHNPITVCHFDKGAFRQSVNFSFMISFSFIT